MATLSILYPEEIVSVAANREDGRASMEVRAATTGPGQHHIMEEGKTQMRAREKGILDSPLQTVMVATALAAMLGLWGRRNRPVHQ